MTTDQAISYLEINKPSSGYPGLCEAIDMALAALRAAPPAPAPELVALVQRYQRAYGVMQRVNDGEQRVDADTEGDLADEEREAHEALLAWTPAVPVEPPARPETRHTCLDIPAGCDACDTARPETAASTPAPTREQLESIEWGAGDAHRGACCPACFSPRIAGHRDGCWLAAALSSPVGETPEMGGPNEHEYRLIAAAVGERGMTDSSTPLHVRVQNLVDAWDTPFPANFGLEGLLRELKAAFDEVGTKQWTAATSRSRKAIDALLAFLEDRNV